MLPDGVGQVSQGLFVKPLSGLMQTELHLGDGQGDRAGLLGLQVGVPHEGAQTPA